MSGHNVHHFIIANYHSPCLFFGVSILWAFKEYRCWLQTTPRYSNNIMTEIPIAMYYFQQTNKQTNKQTHIYIYICFFKLKYFYGLCSVMWRKIYILYQYYIYSAKFRYVCTQMLSMYLYFISRFQKVLYSLYIYSFEWVK